MKYVLVAGWGKGDEWHDFCIGIHDDWYTAVGHAYEYLCGVIDSYDSIEYEEDGRKKYIGMEEIISISMPYRLADDQGWVVWTEIKKHKVDPKIIENECIPDDNYVRIFEFNDKETEDGRNKESL